jgi:hypothetical protein
LTATPEGLDRDGLVAALVTPARAHRAVALRREHVATVRSRAMEPLVTRRGALVGNAARETAINAAEAPLDAPTGV